MGGAAEARIQLSGAAAVRRTIEWGCCRTIDWGCCRTNDWDCCCCRRLCGSDLYGLICAARPYKPLPASPYKSLPAVRTSAARPACAGSESSLAVICMGRLAVICMGGASLLAVICMASHSQQRPCHVPPLLICWQWFVWGAGSDLYGRLAVICDCLVATVQSHH